MSLRPRYSLLTLLILTAFIAGGAAFWMRPKQVIEQITPNMEMESTYVRNWRGDWIIDGPQVIREYFHGEINVFTSVGFGRAKLNLVGVITARLFPKSRHARIKMLHRQNSLCCHWTSVANCSVSSIRKKSVSSQV